MLRRLFGNSQQSDPDPQTLYRWESLPSARHSIKNHGVYTIDKPVKGWKATSNGVAKLIVPSGATVVRPRSSSSMVKYRADKLYVHEICGARMHGFKDPLDNYAGELVEVPDETDTNLFSYDDFEYREGKVHETDLDEDTAERCSEGLHFFGHKDDAIDMYIDKR